MEMPSALWTSASAPHGWDKDFYIGWAVFSALFHFLSSSLDPSLPFHRSVLGSASCRRFRERSRNEGWR